MELPTLKKFIQFRRSLYVVQVIKVGDMLIKYDVRAIRLGLRMPAKYLEQVSSPLFFVFQPIGIMPPIAAHAEC